MVQDAALAKAVARGFGWFEELTSGRVRSIEEIAIREGVTDRNISQTIDRALVPPEVVEGILGGHLEA
jgi:hypothetical protein